MYTPHKLCMKLALWVARRHRPYAIISDPELIDILTDLNSKVIVPSPSTVSRDVREIYAMSRKGIVTILQVWFHYKSLLNGMTWHPCSRIQARSTSVLMDGPHQMWYCLLVWWFIGLLKGVYSPWYWISSSFIIYFIDCFQVLTLLGLLKDIWALTWQVKCLNASMTMGYMTRYCLPCLLNGT